MKFTQEDVETTIDEIKDSLHCLAVDYKHDSYFEIRAKYWTEDDFQGARKIGLDVQGVQPVYLGNDREGHPQFGVAIDVEYIGRHRIVMG